jgi:hypothetical protein
MKRDRIWGVGVYRLCVDRVETGAVHDATSERTSDDANRLLLDRLACRNRAPSRDRMGLMMKREKILMERMMMMAKMLAEN